MAEKGRMIMVPEAESDQEELRERDNVGPEVEPETKKPKRKSLRLQDPFYLFLSACLPQFILKYYFAERQF